MHLTISKGFFQKDFLIARDGGALAGLGIVGMTASLRPSDGGGAHHQYVIETRAEGSHLALIWRRDGQDMGLLEPMTAGTVVDGIAMTGGLRYGLEPMENKSFSLRCDGRPVGTLVRTGNWFSRGYVMETGQDIPVEAAGMLVFMALAYPALRLFAYVGSR